ncbi:hypothetical protein L228DRAFT_7279 [Xylona heveae TC161]|uniref:Autophagy-related protein 28 n=1 Tax=Xylona heveae (strain CBS 132557 / TC161) TaxID=1328760 RepID=A0A165JG40_XYLHT|nr:hypothetical protein L228DRAFT_7279 [Xylona heveae TC161]KZF26190.1 hypothetical protein L228DRAFT_7279 [Xylona heveae TC161]
MIAAFRSFFGDAPRSSSSALPGYDAGPSAWTESVPLKVNSSSHGSSSSPFSASNFTPHNAHPDPLLALRRREHYIQQDLQTLLDAQADGLIAGLTGDGQAHDVSSSTGSSTPTSSRNAPEFTKASVTAQSSRRRPGLRAARRGILSSMHELALVKDEESHILEVQMSERDQVLERITAWAKKKDGLRKEIEDIKKGHEALQLHDLKLQSGDLEREISVLEERLGGMKARHRALAGEISRLENSVQAKLSSYTTSLSMVDSQVQGFLAKPPLKVPRDFDEQMSFLSLQPERRTLDLAKEHWQVERDFFHEKYTSAEAERDALEDGAVIWNDVITEAMAFEKRLRNEMRNIGSSRSLPSNSRKDARDHDDASKGMKEILQLMDQTILQIESKFKLAETRGWKLLVCCIGAELEAFKEGKEILAEALDALTTTSNQGLLSSVEEQDQTASNAWLDSPAGLSPVHSHSPKSDSRRETVAEPIDRSEDEDDEPDPELLISHQDTDL